MIKGILITAIIFIIGTFSLGVYLSPNDLKRCDQSPSEQSGCQKAGAIVAVSGGNTSVRAAEAIELYKNGWGEYLIFSGAAYDTDAPSNAAVMRRQAINAGIDAEKIITEDDSRTTKQNAKLTDELLASKGITDIIVVTSPYHQRRAGLEFEKMTNGAVMVRNHPASHDPDWPVAWWLTPRGWWLALGEFGKTLATYMGESQ